MNDRPLATPVLLMSLALRLLDWTVTAGDRGLDDLAADGDEVGIAEVQVALCITTARRALRYTTVASPTPRVPSSHGDRPLDGIPARINALTERIEEQLPPLQPAITPLSSISGIGTRQGQVIRTAIGLYVDGVVA
jgi:hypothetical protein